MLDTSTLLATLHQEPGADVFLQTSGRLESSAMSAVNIAEAFGKLVGLGICSADAWDAVIAPIPDIVDFDTEQKRELQVDCCRKLVRWDHRWRPRLPGSWYRTQGADLYRRSGVERFETIRSRFMLFVRL